MAPLWTPPGLALGLQLLLLVLRRSVSPTGSRPERPGVLPAQWRPFGGPSAHTRAQARGSWLCPLRSRRPPGTRLAGQKQPCPCYQDLVLPA